MKYLQIHNGCTVIRLQQITNSNSSLEEQAAPYLAQNPFLLLDVEGLQFTSMNIGELVNLKGAFSKIWEPSPHRLGLLNLNSEGQQVFKISKLDQELPMFDSVAEAFKEFAGE